MKRPFELVAEIQANEIERLKSELVKAYSEVTYQRTLITECADALEQQSCWSTKVELIRRAREATK